jgi:hypothetical protein
MADSVLDLLSRWASMIETPMLEGVDVSGGGYSKERRGQDRVLIYQLGLDAHAGESPLPCGDSSGSTPSCSRLGRASCLFVPFVPANYLFFFSCKAAPAIFSPSLLS